MQALGFWTSHKAGMMDFSSLTTKIDSPVKGPCRVEERRSQG